MLSPRPAREEDLGAVLRLFDQAQAWLITQGLEGQWGSSPFSGSPEQRERFAAWIRQGTLFVWGNPVAADAVGADPEKGEIFGGTLVLSDEPPAYVAAQLTGAPGPGLYLQAFATDPALRGKGLGTAMLEWAQVQAQARGLQRIRLDCWAGNPRLRRYYREAGFREVAPFTVGGWTGQLFERELGAGEPPEN